MLKDVLLFPAFKRVCRNRLKSGHGWSWRKNEIWSESVWDQYASEVEGKYEDITEEIMDTGI